MSFLNTFIELSLLDAAELHSSQLEKQNGLLNKQNILLHQQNESINYLIRHNEQQDYIRDYIYRLNKLCGELEKTNDKNSIDFYYAIYCLAKGVSDSGITTSVISEVKDKEYFDNCLNKLENLLYTFVQNNKDKITEYNNYIRTIEEETILLKLKAFEDEKLRIDETKKIIKKYERRNENAGWGYLFGFIPFIVFLCIYLPKEKYSSTSTTYLILILGPLISLILGTIIRNKLAKTTIKKGEAPLTKEQYEELKKEKEQWRERQPEEKFFYDYAKTVFPEIIFDNNKKFPLTEQVDSILEKKRNEIQNANDAFSNSYEKIYNTFYLAE